MTTWTVTTGWVLFGIAVLVTFVIVAHAIAFGRKSTTPAAVTRPPAAGAGTSCSSTGCGFRASSIVIDNDGDTRLVCKGCCDEGEAHGWWRWIADLRPKSVAA